MNEEQIRYVFEVVGDEAVKDLNAISKGFDELGRGFKQIGSLSKSFSNTFKRATKSVNGLTKAFSALTGVAIGKALSDGAKEAIDLYESINLLKVTFGDSSDEAQEFVEHITDMYGFDTRTIVDMAGSFKAMGNAVGMTSEVSTDLAKSLTALTIDLSSLHNMELESTFQRVQSSMQGISKSAKILKMDIRATTVEAWANANGIKRQFETMSEAERELLRYTLMVKQARDAIGDFAHTADYPANQLRILNQQFTELGRTIGQFFNPVLQQVLPVLIGLAMALRTIVEMLAVVFSVELDWDKIAGRDNSDGLYDTASGLDDVGASADGAAKKINKLIAPFDELNVLSENTGSSGFGGGVNFGEVDPAILDLFYQMQYEATEAALKAQEFKEQILDFLGITYDDNKKSWVFAPIAFKEHLQETFKFAEQTIEALFNLDYSALGNNLATVFSDIGSIIGRTIDIIYEDFTRLTGITIDDTTVSDWINNLNTNLENLHTYLTENEEPIAQFLAKLVEGLGAVALVAPVLGILGDGFVTLGIAAMGISGVVNAISGLAGAISPVISTVMGGLSGLVTFLTTNLTGLGIGALLLFVAGFIDGFRDIWTNSEQFRENIGMLFANIGNMIQSIVSLISTVINQIVELLSPFINTIGDILQPVYTFIVNLINSIVGVVTGVIEIIDGLLQGDLKQVFKGFMKVLMGLVEAVMNIGAGIVNTILSLIFSAINAVGRLIYSVIKLAVKSVNAFTDLLGIKPMGLPDESLFVFDKVPQIVPPAFDYSFGNGGVVTGPTRALIGEAGRAEMVMPLDNSPQMQQFISQIADAVRGNNAQPMEVHVYLDSRAIASGMYDELHNVEFRRGASLIS